MRNRRSVACVACLKRLVLTPRGLPLMRWLRLCLRRAATDFFSTAKKVGERGTTAPAVQKCRSHTPRGALHSANRFCNSTTCAGLPSGLQDGCGLRDGLARCARWLCLMVFWDGLVAMTSLTYCVTARGLLDGNTSHHMRTTDIQFGIIRSCFLPFFVPVCTPRVSSYR